MKSFLWSNKISCLISSENYFQSYYKFWASLTAQLVKNLPAMQETRVQSSGQEDPLEKGMATHSSILAWRNPWTGLQPTESQRVQHN